MERKTKMIRVRLTESQYAFLKQFDIGDGISDVIRKFIDAFYILDKMPILEALMPLEKLKKKQAEIEKELKQESSF